MEPMKININKMTFEEALKKLGIEEYAERIFNSNSRGEIFHLEEYINMAELLPDHVIEKFPAWFRDVVKFAEENWERPESVFQHIQRIMLQE
jgi:hypothetical protein